MRDSATITSKRFKAALTVGTAYPINSESHFGSSCLTSDFIAKSATLPDNSSLPGSRLAHRRSELVHAGPGTIGLSLDGLENGGGIIGMQHELVELIDR